MLEDMSNLFQVFVTPFSFLPCTLPRDYPRTYKHDGRHKSCPLFFPGTVGYIALANPQKAPMDRGQRTQIGRPSIGSSALLLIIHLRGDR